MERKFVPVSNVDIVRRLKENWKLRRSCWTGGGLIDNRSTIKLSVDDLYAEDWVGCAPISKMEYSGKGDYTQAVYWAKQSPKNFFKLPNENVSDNIYRTIVNDKIATVEFCPSTGELKHSPAMPTVSMDRLLQKDWTLYHHNTNCFADPAARVEEPSESFRKIKIISDPNGIFGLIDPSVMGRIF